jgi:hypothetical protein
MSDIRSFLGCRTQASHLFRGFSRRDRNIFLALCTLHPVGSGLIDDNCKFNYLRSLGAIHTRPLRFIFAPVSLKLFLWQCERPIVRKERQRFSVYARSDCDVNNINSSDRAPQDRLEERKGRVHWTQPFRFKSIRSFRELSSWAGRPGSCKQPNRSASACAGYGRR